jgi:uncharacterized membrane protein
MRHWLIFVGLAVLALVGVLALVQTPISDCVEIYEQGAPVSVAALVMFAMLIWLMPNDRSAFTKASAALLAILLAVVILYQPTGVAQYRQDVLGCAAKADAKPI